MARDVPWLRFVRLYHHSCCAALLLFHHNLKVRKYFFLKNYINIFWFQIARSAIPVIILQFGSECWVLWAVALLKINWKITGDCILIQVYKCDENLTICWVSSFLRFSKRKGVIGEAAAAPRCSHNFGWGSMHENQEGKHVEGGEVMHKVCQNISQ